MDKLKELLLSKDTAVKMAFTALGGMIAMSSPNAAGVILVTAAALGLRQLYKTINDQ